MKYFMIIANSHFDLKNVSQLKLHISLGSCFKFTCRFNLSFLSNTSWKSLITSLQQQLKLKLLKKYYKSN